MRKIVVVIVFVSALSWALNAKSPTGSLFIIGGGEVNTDMCQTMYRASGLDQSGYMVILPMSSEQEPLVNAQEIKAVFKSIPQLKIFYINVQKGDPVSAQLLDSIRNAKLIYISGGDQMRFLNVTKGTGINQAIHDAFNKGAMIAGTSAGASLMSRVMVTGNELKFPDDNFARIQAGNVETAAGLGFLKNVTIDQHFVVRKRYNRMLSYGLENTNHMSVGIDESTAIFVQNKKAQVYGQSQVIVLRNKGARIAVQNNLLGAKGLKLDIYLPGDSFTIY